MGTSAGRPANPPWLGFLQTCPFLCKRKMKSRSTVPGWGSNIRPLLLRKTPLETEAVHGHRARKADGPRRQMGIAGAPWPVTLDGTVRKGCHAPSANPRPRLEHSHCVGGSVGTMCHLVDKRRVDFFSVNDSQRHVLLRGSRWMFVVTGVRLSVGKLRWMR